MKDKIIKNSEGHWIFHCPGCGYGHFFDHRWTWNGSTTAPTFRASLLIGGVVGEVGAPREHRCHLFVTDGKIQYLSDCTHELAGKTVEMESVDS